MDAEKLKRATELNSDIREIKDQIENLEKSDRINDDLNLQTGYLRRKFIDFNLRRRPKSIKKQTNYHQTFFRNVRKSIS